MVNNCGAKKLIESIKPLDNIYSAVVYQPQRIDRYSLTSSHTTDRSSRMAATSCSTAVTPGGGSSSLGGGGGGGVTSISTGGGMGGSGGGSSSSGSSKYRTASTFLHTLFDVAFFAFCLVYKVSLLDVSRGL